MKTALQQLEEQHKELSDRIAELVEKHKEQGEKIAAMKNPERIRVPENIKFEEVYDELYLVSPNGKCLLGAFIPHGGIPHVTLAGRGDGPEDHLFTDPLYLEPRKREDLKCGDIAFATGFEKLNNEYYDVCCYEVILNDYESASWNNDMDILVGGSGFAYWYKVVR